MDNDHWTAPKRLWVGLPCQIDFLKLFCQIVVGRTVLPASFSLESESVAFKSVVSPRSFCQVDTMQLPRDIWGAYPRDRGERSVLAFGLRTPGFLLPKFVITAIHGANEG